jgi:hypothetical protein
MIKLAIPAAEIYYSYNRDIAKNKDIPSLAGAVVYICDYSFPLDVIFQIAKSARDIYLYDHHITALREVFGSTPPEEMRRFKIVLRVGSNVEPQIASEDVPSYITNHCRQITDAVDVQLASVEIGERPHVDPNSEIGCTITLLFDLDKCGAEITYEEVAAPARISRPWYLRHIRDRDLYEWKDPKSRYFSEALHDIGPTEANFCRLDLMSEAEIAKFYLAGEEIIAHTEYFIKKIVAKSERVRFRGHRAVVAESKILQSEIGNALMTAPGNESAEIGIVIRYNFESAFWNVSLRGIRERSPDLSEIACYFGGGGHYCAAGFDFRGSRIADILLPGW